MSQAGPHSASTSSDPAPNAYASTWSTYPSESQKMTYPLLKQWLDSVLPQPVPPQLTKPSDYDRYCNANNAGVCFIAVLPAGAASDADAEAAALKGAEIVDADAVERASGPLTVFRRIAASNYIQPDYQVSYATALECVDRERAVKSMMVSCWSCGVTDINCVHSCNKQHAHLAANIKTANPTAN